VFHRGKQKIAKEIRLKQEWLELTTLCANISTQKNQCNQDNSHQLLPSQKQLQWICQLW